MNGNRSRIRMTPPMTIPPSTSSSPFNWGPTPAIWSAGPAREIFDIIDQEIDSLGSVGSMGYTDNSSYTDSKGYADSKSYTAGGPFLLAGPPSRNASFATPMSPPKRLPYPQQQIQVSPRLSEVGSLTYPYEAPVHGRVLIRRLPATTSEADMRLMLVFSQELLSIELMGPESTEGAYYRSALVRFRSVSGATEARNMLDGRASLDGLTKMAVTIQPLPDYGSLVSAPFAMPNGAPNASSDLFTTPVYRSQPAPVGNGFPPRDAMSPTSKGGRFFPTAPPHQDLAAPDTKAGSHYKNLFNPQSPIGNHLANEVPGRLGKHLIKNERNDKEEGGIIGDAFAHTGQATPTLQRGTTPQDPLSQGMANLVLKPGASSTPAPMPPSYLGGLPPVNGNGNGNSNGNYLSLGQQLQHQLQHQLQQQQQQQQHQRHVLSQLPQQNPQQQSVPQHNKHQQHQHQQHQQQQHQQQQHQQQQHQQQHQHQQLQHQQLQQQQQHHQRAQPQQEKQEKQPQQQPPYGKANFPPVNPADQNPPCNTLYVGNLPIDTSEEELKALFSPVRGYKRLCFRTKQNGPMCFVEFEDVGHATKALSQLYGWCLHNSIKGGIRLSFSKNPLGVRSPPSQPSHGNMPPVNGMAPSTANGFTAASGPPPGLPKPANYGNRAYTSYSPNGRNGSNMGTPINGSSAVSGFQRTPFYKNGINMAKPHTPFA
ncbi:hypothetical protein V8C35DRAFT_151300 [Trichoderma chlorosporum]